MRGWLMDLWTHFLVWAVLLLLLNTFKTRLKSARGRIAGLQSVPTGLIKPGPSQQPETETFLCVSHVLIIVTLYSYDIIASYVVMRFFSLMQMPLRWAWMTYWTCSKSCRPMPWHTCRCSCTQQPHWPVLPSSASVSCRRERWEWYTVRMGGVSSQCRGYDSFISSWRLYTNCLCICWHSLEYAHTHTHTHTHMNTMQSVADLGGAADWERHFTL